MHGSYGEGTAKSTVKAESTGKGTKLTETSVEKRCIVKRRTVLRFEPKMSVPKRKRNRLQSLMKRAGGCPIVLAFHCAPFKVGRGT